MSSGSQERRDIEAANEQAADDRAGGTDEVNAMQETFTDLAGPIIPGSRRPDPTFRSKARFLLLGLKALGWKLVRRNR